MTTPRKTGPPRADDTRAAGCPDRIDPEEPMNNPQPALTDAERTMLTYALDQAQEKIWSEDGFTDEDQAAVTSLRRLAAETQPDTERPRCPHCQLPHDLTPGSTAARACEMVRADIAEAERRHAEGDHSRCAVVNCEVVRARRSAAGPAAVQTDEEA